MARCGKCGTDFPTCYMDTVSICPNCKTEFYNDSPYILKNSTEQSPNRSTTQTDGQKKE